MKFTDEEIAKCVERTCNLFERQSRTSFLGNEFFERAYSKEDLAQECYLKAYSLIDRFDDIRGMGLFYRSLMNHIIDIYSAYRKRRLTLKPDIYMPPSEEGGYCCLMTDMALSEDDEPDESIMYDEFLNRLSDEEWPYYKYLAGILDRNKLAQQKKMHVGKACVKARELAVVLRDRLNTGL